MSNRPDTAMTRCIAALRAAGATGTEQYEQKLRNNANKPEVLQDLLLEGRAALMFLRHRFKVGMQDKPDLRIELDGEIVYVEVKHFREKEQDRTDERSMSETTDLLVPYGDTVEREGADPWDQLANVAKSKVGQYVADFANVLVVESSSASLELALGTAVHNYDKQVLKSDDVRLRRLSGIMLVQTDRITCGEGRNVEFCPTRHAATPLGERTTDALFAIVADMFPGTSRASVATR
jgi:hypothetical protein